MKYLLGILLIYFFLLGGNIFAYNTKIFPLLVRVCDGEDILICNDYYNIQENIDTHIEYFGEIFKSLPSCIQRNLIKKIKTISIKIYFKERKEKNDKKLFKLQYTRFLFRKLLDFYQEQEEGIFVSQNTIQKRGTGNILKSKLRQEVIRQLIHHGFSHFVQRPYIGMGGHIVTFDDDWQKYSVHDTIFMRDDLDYKIDSYLKNKQKDFWFSKDEWKKWRSLYLFKNTEDLHTLGYQVVSHRKRVNKDDEYRRFNIAKAFELIGHVKILNPGDTFSYLQDSQFDPTDQSIYKIGKSIFLDELIEDYGGGLCGGSTAIYQGSFLNQGLEIHVRNHTKRYNNLYRATINGVYQKIPGIDSTIYSPSLDLRITNIRDYPIILIMNYDGEYGSIEEIFTLGYIIDRGSYEYQGKKIRGFMMKTKEGLKKVQGACYTRKINEKLVERCYKEIF